jgi:hypothetical protein
MTPQSSTTSRLIEMAATLVGEEEVREAMRASPADFKSYCAGRKEAPYDELGRLVDVIVREQEKVILKNREIMSRIRSRDPRV